MSISSINSGNNVDRTRKPEQNNGQNTADRTILTQSQFTNSIMTALNKSSLNKTQISQFSQQATNIFSRIDNDPQDGKITQKEANNGGAAILASFYEQVNNALNGINTVSNVDKTNRVNNANNVNNDEIQPSRDLDNSDIQAFADAGFPVINQSVDQEGNITLKVKSSDNQIGTIKINKEDGSVQVDDIGKQAFDAAQVKAQEAYEAQENNAIQDVNTNFNAVIDKYEKDGYKPTGSLEMKNINGQEVAVGTFKKDSGEEIQVKFNPKTGKEIE